MPTAAVFMGAGLLELSDEPSESESLVLVDELAELVRVLMLPLALLALPEARPEAVACAPVAVPTRDPPAPPVTEATAPDAPEMRLEICPTAPVAPAPISDVREPAREPASPRTLEAWPPRDSTAEAPPASALVTWLATPSRSLEAVSRGPLGSMAEPTFESAAPRSWACGWVWLVTCPCCGVICASGGTQGLTETAAARPRRIMEERILRVVRDVWD